MNKTAAISEGEWEVMEVLWRQPQPLTALAIVQALTPHHSWQDTTIRTMLRRLVQKKAVGFSIEGKIYYYRALVSREKCVEKVSNTFLERIFAGAAGPLVLHFVNSKPMTSEELAQIEAIINAKKKGNKK